MESDATGGFRTDPPVARRVSLPRLRTDSPHTSFVLKGSRYLLAFIISRHPPADDDFGLSHNSVSMPSVRWTVTPPVAASTRIVRPQSPPTSSPTNSIPRAARTSRAVSMFLSPIEYPSSVLKSTTAAPPRQARQRRRRFPSRRTVLAGDRRRRSGGATSGGAATRPPRVDRRSRPRDTIRARSS